MSSSSSIEWTESTWNPVTGCSKISPGCKHCYAERMARRLKAMGQMKRLGRPMAKGALQSWQRIDLQQPAVDFTRFEFGTEAADSPSR